MKRELEPTATVRLAFARRIFVAAPGVRLTWEALSIGLELINAQHDSRGATRRLSATSSDFASALCAQVQTPLFTQEPIA